MTYFNPSTRTKGFIDQDESAYDKVDELLLAMEADERDLAATAASYGGALSIPRGDADRFEKQWGLTWYDRANALCLAADIFELTSAFDGPSVLRTGLTEYAEETELDIQDLLDLAHLAHEMGWLGSDYVTEDALVDKYVAALNARIARDKPFWTR